MKICSKCKEEKPLDCFTPAKRNKDGKCGQCKKCRFKVILLWRDKNKVSYTANKRINDHLYHTRHPEQRFENGKKWRENNKEKLKEEAHLYYSINKSIIRDKHKMYWKNNPTKRSEHQSKAVEQLSDSYIKGRGRGRGFTTEQLNNYPELIETIRLIVQTKRLCKTSQN